MRSVRAKLVVGADGALSQVARQEVSKKKPAYVFAYHEVIRAPAYAENDSYDGDRCDVIYDGATSPDFYSWVFPHGKNVSVGTGSAQSGFKLRDAVAQVRQDTGLASATTIRKEGAPIPMKPLKRWENGRDVILAGDAAGVVAPASGEGIYYAMIGGQLAAMAGNEFLETGKAKALKKARRAFMKQHGRVFWVLGMHAVLLVLERQAARALRQHVRRQGCPGADLAGLHEQGARAGQAGRPRAHLLQGHGAPAGAGHADLVLSATAMNGAWLRGALAARRSSSTSRSRALALEAVALFVWRWRAERVRAARCASGSSLAGGNLAGRRADGQSPASTRGSLRSLLFASLPAHRLRPRPSGRRCSGDASRTSADAS